MSSKGSPARELGTLSFFLTSSLVLPNVDAFFLLPATTTPFGLEIRLGRFVAGASAPEARRPAADDATASDGDDDAEDLARVLTARTRRPPFRTDVRGAPSGCRSQINTDK